MSQITLRGTTEPLLERVTISSDPQRGFVLHSHYSGIGAQQMSDLANEYIANGVQVEYAQENGVYRLDANDATLNNPIDNWELIGSDERLDLFQNPRWAAAITESQMGAIRSYLDQNIPPHGVGNVGGAFDAPVAGSILADLTSLAGGVVERAYSRYQAGNDEFENDAFASGYVLRHSTNFPARFTTNIADFNVGSIYSTAHLITEVSNTSLWVFPCPNALVFALNLAGSNIPTFRPNYFWGWKKARSNRETIANNRIQITQSYILAQWSSDDYATF